MASKRERQPRQYRVLPGPAGAVGDVDSVSTSEHGVTVTLFGHDLHYEVTTVETDSGPEITHLWLKGTKDRPITTADLRRIPLQRLAFAAARYFNVINAIESYYVQPEHAPERPRQYDDAHYQAVAAAARDAFRRGLKVRDTVAKHFYKSPYTVDKWLRECRERGYLQRGELQRTKNPQPTKDGNDA